MDCCDDRSACRRSTAVFLLFVVISLLACSPLARSRQTITTVAPICASASAVAFPIPELAPVTMQIFPCILLFTVGIMRSFLDILPMGKPRGLPLSRVGFPASRRRARFGFHRTWSYSLSTGRHRKPCGQHIFRSIDITVMLDAALGTCPGTDIKRKRVKNMTTVETALRGRIPRVNLDERSPVPLCFVCELSHKLTPSHIRDGLGKLVVLYHILDVQTLDAYDLVLTYDLCRELVLRVTPPIGNPGMNTSDLQLSLATVLRAFLLLRMSTLRLCQFLFIRGRELRITVGLTIACNDHRLQSQIKPDLLIDDRQMLDIFLNQD